MLFISYGHVVAWRSENFNKMVGFITMGSFEMLKSKPKPEPRPFFQASLT